VPAALLTWCGDYSPSHLGNGPKSDKENRQREIFWRAKPSF